jgi:Tol biopolymer transport system component
MQMVRLAQHATLGLLLLFGFVACGSDISGTNPESHGPESSDPDAAGPGTGGPDANDPSGGPGDPDGAPGDADADDPDDGSASPQPGTERVSVSTHGVVADGPSGEPAISAGGRYVAFSSIATNLVEGDTNAVIDVFVRDRVALTTERVSVGDAGREANGPSREPAISADGRLVAFSSAATNLVEGDTNGVVDVFVHDRLDGTTERVSVSSAGEEANGGSAGPSISPDGRHVWFTTEATNLEGGRPGLYVHDRRAGTTAFVSHEVTRYAASADARSVAIQVPGPPLGEIHLLDRQTGSSQPVSVDASGEPANRDSEWPSISDDGRFVAFQTLANNLVAGMDDTWSVVVHDRDTRTSRLASVSSDGDPADDFSFFPAISGDGRRVAYSSLAGNLTAGEAHVGWSLFVHDLEAGGTERVPVSSGPQHLAGFDHALSADGRHVAFVSVATVRIDGFEAGVDGIDGEPNGIEEVFAHGLAWSSPSDAAAATAGR